MLQDEFDEQPQWWSWQRRRGAERQNDKVHYDEDAKPIQDRAKDDIATQERNSVNAENKSHPVLVGVTDFVSKYSLYKTAPIAGDAKLLLTGKTEEGEEPVAWTREQKGSKVVYIALGGVQDWKNPIFVRLVTNALFWAADFSAKKNETQ